MNYEKLTLKQYMQLVVLVMIGGTVLANVGSSVGGDVWILYIVAAMAGCCIFGIYYRLLQLHDFRSFPLIFERCIGFWGGKVLCVAYAVFFLYRTKVIGDGLTEMASFQLMNNAPRRLTMLVLLSACLYACHKGIRAIGRSVEVMFVVFIVCLIPFFLTSFISGAFTPSHFLPILRSGGQGFWKKTASVIMLPYSELLLMATFAFKVDRREQRKIFPRACLAITVATTILIGISMSNLAILGKHLAGTLKYPFYNAMMTIGIHGVLERLDPIAAVIIIIAGFYKAAVFFYGWLEMAHSVTYKISRNVIIILTGLGIISSLPTSARSDSKFLATILPFKIMPIFQLGIPIALWLITEIKHYLRQKKEAKETVIPS